MESFAMCNAQETAIRHLSGQQVVSGIEIDRGVFADDVLLFSEHLPREIEAADIHKLYRVLGDHPALRDCMGNPDNPGGSLGRLVHQRRHAEADRSRRHDTDDSDDRPVAEHP